MLNSAYRKRDGQTIPRLSEAHQAMLEVESGIAPEIIAERGYRTGRRSEVPPDFRGYQRRAGLLIPLYSPDGATSGHQLRPKNPRRDKRGKPIKYETPAGARIIADVHPSMLEAVADPSTPLWITEGVKCGDALTSRGRCTIALIGVWMFRAKGAPDLLPCFDHVALQARRVFVVFDSDVMTKPEVQMALERLIGDLEDRGARVLVVYLPDAEDGGKLGVDDALARGVTTVEQLEEMARPFTPSDAARERMRRDDRLRAGVAELWRIWRVHDWRGTGGHTRREVMRAVIEEAERRGAPVEGGILVRAAQRPLAERVGTGQKTVWRSLKRLEADGLIRRAADTERAADAPAAYILLTPAGEGRARGSHNGKTQRGRDGARKQQEERKARNRAESDPGDSPLRALAEIRRLRWPYVARVWTEDGYQHEYVRRLGKIAGRLLEALIADGGVASVAQLAAAVGHARPRDLRRRQIGKLEGAEIARVEGDTVLLAADWPEKLGIARELGREYEAEQLARERHSRQRAAYRRYRVRGETHSAGALARMRREKQRDRREAREARRRRAREAARVLRPNYWAWRERAHLEDAGADGYVRELSLEPDHKRDPPAVAVVPPEPEEPEHPWHCGCPECGQEPRYVRPYGGAR
jgi:DNA-binding MarR family transcriptional regulator